MATYPNEVAYGPARRIAVMGALFGGTFGWFLGDFTFTLVHPVPGIAPNSPAAFAATSVVAILVAIAVGLFALRHLKRGGIAILETLRPKELRIEADWFECHLPNPPRLVEPRVPVTWRVSYDRVWKIGMDHGMYTVEWNASDRFMDALKAFQETHPWAHGPPGALTQDQKLEYQRFLDSMPAGEARAHILVSKENALRLRAIWLPKVRAIKAGTGQALA